MGINNASYALRPGTKLHGRNTYTINKVLGHGTFGITYMATTADGSIVAVKEFFMHDLNGRQGTAVTTSNKQGTFDYYRKKFVRESANLSKLMHPNIIRVMEAWQENDTVYYSMEYLEGGSLDELIAERHGLSEKAMLRYARDIAMALADMHKSGMLHLDLKPANVMLHEGRAVLIDFGLSKQYDESGNPESSTSVGLGSPGYAPIEQASYRDGKDFPVKMDVYALGATMYKMLTGLTPPPASEVLNDGFPDGPLLAIGTTPAIIELIREAMAPMKKDRTPTVEALYKKLVAIKGRDKQTKGNATAGEAVVVGVDAPSEGDSSATLLSPSQPSGKSRAKAAGSGNAQPFKYLFEYGNELKGPHPSKMWITVFPMRVEMAVDNLYFCQRPITKSQFLQFERKMQTIVKDVDKEKSNRVIAPQYELRLSKENDTTLAYCYHLKASATAVEALKKGYTSDTMCADAYIVFEKLKKIVPYYSELIAEINAFRGSGSDSGEEQKTTGEGGSDMDGCAGKIFHIALLIILGIIACFVVPMFFR